jgi:hypothetical protein
VVPRPLRSVVVCQRQRRQHESASWWRLFANLADTGLGFWCVAQRSSENRPLRGHPSSQDCCARVHRPLDGVRKQRVRVDVVGSGILPSAGWRKQQDLPPKQSGTSTRKGKKHKKNKRKRLNTRTHTHAGSGHDLHVNPSRNLSTAASQRRELQHPHFHASPSPLSRPSSSRTTCDETLQARSGPHHHQRD